jgi:hypothetical protein
VQGEKEQNLNPAWDIMGYDSNTPINSRPIIMPVLAMGDLRMFECPMTAIPGWVWDTINLVNNCTDGDGNLLHLPYPGTYLDQPVRFRHAVEITRSERARRNEELQKEAEAKAKSGR